MDGVARVRMNSSSAPPSGFEDIMHMARELQRLSAATSSLYIAPL